MLLRASDVVANIAQLAGTTEQSIRLISSLIAGLPLALLYRQYIYAKNATLQHIYFTLCGMALCYFNFGNDTIHSFANIVIIYLMLRLIGGTKQSVAAGFIINMTYLLYAYIYSVGDNNSYVISWSTPHCVLTLRLTGLVFDIYDGQKKKEDLSADQKETELSMMPSLLEMCGYTYYFGGFLTGPQFSMRRYRSFISGAFTKNNEKPDSVLIGFKRSLTGVLCITVFQIADMWLPTDFMVTDEFADMAYWRKMGYLMLWGKFHLYKYIGVWLITEGACIITGLTYNGVDSDGLPRWDGCANVKLHKLEFAQSFQECIDSFNVNTNQWMARYVYKRLRFMGSKAISQNVTLLFLAIWHGLFSGYFNNFILEFFIMKAEGDMRRLVYGNPNSSLAQFCESSAVKPVLSILKKMFVSTFLAYPLSSFVLLSFDRFWKFYSSIYFTGHIIFVSWPLVYILITLLIKSKKKQLTEIRNGNAPPVKSKDD